ncbi:MAG: hypothetical protein ACRDP8_06070 [Actinopolymorphaceae bacterium]
MSRICHEHCPTGERSGWIWLAVMVGAAGGALWLLGEILTGLGKTVMAVTAGTALVVVGVILAIAVRTAVRNSTGVTGTVTESHPVAGHVTKTDIEPGSGSTSKGETPAERPASPNRPRLRLIRGGRAA